MTNRLVRILVQDPDLVIHSSAHGFDPPTNIFCLHVTALGPFLGLRQTGHGRAYTVCHDEGAWRPVGSCCYALLPMPSFGRDARVSVSASSRLPVSTSTPTHAVVLPIVYTRNASNTLAMPRSADTSSDLSAATATLRAQLLSHPELKLDCVGVLTRLARLRRLATVTSGGQDGSNLVYRGN